MRREARVEMPVPDLFNLQKEILYYLFDYLPLDSTEPRVLNKQLRKIHSEFKNIKKRQTMIFKTLISKEKSLMQNLDNLPLTSFNLKYFNNNIRDFRSYLFGLCERFGKKIFLLSKLNKFYFVSQIDENNIILIYDISVNDLYYMIFQKKIKFSMKAFPTINTDNSGNTQEQSSIDFQGYIMKDGTYIENNLEGVLRLIGQ